MIWDEDTVPRNRGATRTENGGGQTPLSSRACVAEDAVIHIVHLETGRSLYGGARQVLWLCAGLARRGQRSTIVCPPDSDIARSAGELGIAVHALPMRGDLDIGFAWRFVRALRQLQPDIVHVHSRRGADTLGGIGARLAGVPAVLSRRVDSADVPVLGGAKYLLYRRIVAISAGIRARLIAQGVPAAKVQLVRSAVPPAAEPVSRAAFLDVFALQPDDVPVAVVAQFIPRKGHRMLLDALHRLRGRHPHLRVCLFGAGPLRASLERRVAELGLADRIRFAGFRIDLERFIGHFALLVHPAEREGLGVAVLEAQAAGVPVIACRAGGLVEAVADGRTGLLVPPGDAAALATVIDTLLGDAGQRMRFTAAGPAHAAAGFGIDGMVDGNLAVYRDALGRGRENE